MSGVWTAIRRETSMRLVLHSAYIVRGVEESYPQAAWRLSEVRLPRSRTAQTLEDCLPAVPRALKSSGKRDVDCRFESKMKMGCPPCIGEEELPALRGI